MNQEIKKKWLEDLRSGNYKQTTDVLHNNEGFCCLGVLCDIYLKEKGRSWDTLDKTCYVFDETSEDQVLPAEVIEWAQLEDSNPFVLVDFLGEEKELKSLSELNDSGTSFSKIADLIEAQL